MRFVLLLFITISTASAQEAPSTSAVRTHAWFNAEVIDFVAITAGPPAPGSALDRRDMRAVLQAQRTRTSAQIKQAQADDREEDIFIFAPILGANFTASELPITAVFSRHLREASAVINPPLKVRFARPRPFVASTQVHPVCVKTPSNSFPSGHAMVATLEGLALTQIVPERSPEILRRLDQYTHNRVVCGVHYPSDVDASLIVASSLFGLIAASPSFQKELEASKAEIRNHANLLIRPTETAFPEDRKAHKIDLVEQHAKSLRPETERSSPSR